MDRNLRSLMRKKRQKSNLIDAVFNRKKFQGMKRKDIPDKGIHFAV